MMSTHVAVERPDDVAGPRGVRAGHVLDGRRDGQQRRARGQPGDGGDGRDHGAGTGLVHLHLFHPVGRLDADAAGVEADALADDARDGGPAASFSPAPPERITIIRGGLSLPCPTAMNMPMPSSVARSGPMTSIHRPWRLGERTGLLREDLGADVVGGAVGEAAGDVGSLAHDPAALRGALERRDVGSPGPRGSAHRATAGRRRRPRGRSSSDRSRPPRRRGSTSSAARARSPPRCAARGDQPDGDRVDIAGDETPHRARSRRVGPSPGRGRPGRPHATTRTRLTGSSPGAARAVV